MNNNQGKVEGVGRLPVIAPDDMLDAVRKKFPTISGWHAHFAEVASALLDVGEYAKIGHSEPQTCQLAPLGHGEKCGRDSDFILVSVVMEKGSDGSAVPSNSRVRYYCAPCVYATMCRAIQSVSKADKLETVMEEGIADAAADVLEHRADFVEQAIERSAQVVENKYGSEGDALIEELNKKFEGRD